MPDKEEKQDPIDELDEELSEIYCKLTHEAKLREAAVNEAYAIYGKMQIEGKVGYLHPEATEQQGRCLYLKGIFEGWDCASNFLLKLISELIDQKAGRKTKAGETQK